MRHEGEVFGIALITRGTQERLVPVLMTALAAGIALIPLVLAPGEPGKEILHPVAVAIVGGLIGSRWSIRSGSQLWLRRALGIVLLVAAFKFVITS